MFATCQQHFHCDGLLYTSSDGCGWRCRGSGGCRWRCRGSGGCRWRCRGTGGCRWRCRGTGGCRWRCRLAYTGAHSRSPSFQDIHLENGHVGVGPGICLNQVPDEGLGLLALVLIHILHGPALEVTKLHHQAALVSSWPGFCLHFLLPLILLHFFCHLSNMRSVL